MSHEANFTGVNIILVRENYILLYAALRRDFCGAKSHGAH